MRRPFFWCLFAALSAASALVAVLYFPRAFSIVTLDIAMDRERALREARAIMQREGLGPADYRQAASFTLDSEAQTFVELEGGGKEVFTNALREDLYAAYSWRVRQFKEGDVNETTIRFTPAGKAYGFVEKLREDAPGAALDPAAARTIAEAAAGRWSVDLSGFELVEQGQERRVAGRVDHTLTYERPSPTLNEGRYRLRLVVAGDRLTELTHFIRIPEGFTRRYQHMRAANDAIGIGSAVGMALLYVLGGIGVGLFFMLRDRWVIWRPALIWGTAVGLLQALTMLNDLPLLWMDYDTAIARSAFLAEHMARVAASFVAFSVFFALSFMAAETLTRRAFGHHPQLWRVWARRSGDGDASAPGASIQILGRTVGGYLLVPIFLAYVVLFYFVAVRYLGWWSPSESLLHPDVLATYVPWLSAIANSFQAGFWEEALFRAVPLAGAALIGARVGQRRLFLIAALLVQALIFGAGHAQYPGQPAYARPVELVLPSIGFGLLYLYLGLVPAIVLHFTFDVILFALPIFLANAPGIWVQQLMVVLVALIPFWVVLWRRFQVGQWTELSPADRNLAWQPPPSAEIDHATAAIPRAELTGRAKTWWLAAGAGGLIVIAAATVTSWNTHLGSFPIAREHAAALARSALELRGVTLDRRWRVLPAPANGAQAPHEFVFVTAGEERRRELAGRYLAPPHWRVRVATFEGDVADRAEEWGAAVVASGEVRGIRHVLPEGRPGATLDEASARELARQTVLDRFRLDPGRGDVREVSNRPTRLNARTDWTFTFADTTLAPLPQGEPRISIGIAGDEVAAAQQFVHVPEHWERMQRAASTRNLILRILGTMVLAGVLVGAAVHGVIAWSRHRYSPRLFVAAALLMLLLSLTRSANNWPALLASLSTAAPLELQLLGIVGVGLVGLILGAALVGLSLGALPQRLAASGTVAQRDVLPLGLASGFTAAAFSTVAGWLRTPSWALFPNVEPAGTMVPVLQAAIDPLPRLLMASAIVLSALALADHVTSAWTRRRVPGAIALFVVGFAAAGVPAGIAMSGWFAAGTLLGVGLVLAYGTLFRYDMTLAPIALGVMIAASTVAQGAARAFPGALAGSAIGAAAVTLLAWWLGSALRKTRVRLRVEQHAAVEI